MELLECYMCVDDFNPECAKKIAAAAAGLCGLVNAMYNYHIASLIVEPRLAALQIKEAELSDAMDKLAAAQSESAAAQAKVDALQKSFSDTMTEKARIESTAKATADKKIAATNPPQLAGRRKGAEGRRRAELCRRAPFELSSPFKPFEQLLAVLPIASNSVLPPAYRALMEQPTSQLAPFIDEGALKAAIATLPPSEATAGAGGARAEPVKTFGMSSKYETLVLRVAAMSNMSEHDNLALPTCSGSSRPTSPLAARSTSATRWCPGRQQDAHDELPAQAQPARPVRQGVPRREPAAARHVRR